jgi:hypothetical protein
MPLNTRGTTADITEFFVSQLVYNNEKLDFQFLPILMYHYVVSLYYSSSRAITLALLLYSGVLHDGLVLNTRRGPHPASGLANYRGGRHQHDEAGAHRTHCISSTHAV